MSQPDYSKRPADPPHDGDAVRETRRRLRELDGRLDLWWCAKRCRWKVMEWLRRSGSWSFTFYWQGPEGEYRAPTPAEPILRKLCAIDWSEFDQHEATVNQHIDSLSDGRRRKLERRKAEAERIRETYEREVMSIGDELLTGSSPANGSSSGKFRKWDDARKSLKRDMAEVMED